MRTFTDEQGTLWTVLPIRPTLTERRRRERRSRDPGGIAPVPDRRRGERRVLPDFRTRAPITPGFEQGWLTFECEREKRRLPLPNGWEGLSDDGLRELWRLAIVAPKRRGRLIE